jgi:hypothetical protein
MMHFFAELAGGGIGRLKTTLPPEMCTSQHNFADLG